MKKIINRGMAVVSLIVVLGVSGCSSNKAKPQPIKAANYNAQLGAEYLRKGLLNMANDKLERALEQNYRSADAHHYYALLQQKLKRNELAKKHFLIALDLKKSPELYNNYGSFLCKQKKFRSADRQFDNALSDPLYRTPEFAHANAGICASDAGNYVRAKDHFNKALARNPRFASPIMELAQLYYREGDFSRAQAYLFRYNDITGDTERSLGLCRDIHKKLGETAKAEECVSKLLSKFPHSKVLASQ